MRLASLVAPSLVPPSLVDVLSLYYPCTNTSLRFAPLSLTHSEKCKHWSVVHAPCNPGLLEAFGVGEDVLPAVVAYSAKALRYAKRVGKQDPER